MEVPVQFGQKGMITISSTVSQPCLGVFFGNKAFFLFGGDCRLDCRRFFGYDDFFVAVWAVDFADFFYFDFTQRNPSKLTLHSIHSPNLYY
jgi:hypothetical protein